MVPRTSSSLEHFAREDCRQRKRDILVIKVIKLCPLYAAERAIKKRKRATERDYKYTACFLGRVFREVCISVLKLTLLLLKF